jgi:phosphatidate cytidylyltransferase|tara:strand:+ start:1419 stop:2066 length:648 start_codon:yes stop_codon:yes gene_type:complete
MISELKKRIITSIVLIGIFLFCYFIHAYFFYALIAIVSLISWIESNNIFKKIKLRKSLKNINVFLSFSYLSFFAFIVCYSYYEKISLIFILLVCIFSDVGGYIIGKTIGGKKLTKISPKKTISGSIGSLFFSIIPLFILNIYDNDEYPIKIFIFLLCLLISLACQIGDLFVSYLKRKAKVKDTGNILPGHGGLLDRIDGIILAVPVGIVGLIIIY